MNDRPPDNAPRKGETAAEFFGRHANGRTGADLDAALAKVPARPPELGDELPAIGGKPTFKSDAFEAIHSSAAGLFKVGAIDGAAMRRFDATCLIAPPSSRDFAKDEERS